METLKMSELTFVTRPPMPELSHPIVMIGAGGIVNDAHLPAYRKAGFNVAGIFDIDPGKAQRTASAFDIPRVYHSLDEAVNSAPQGAVYDIAVPAGVILDVLPHLPDGAGALIQKPMGENRQTARAIRDHCHAKNLKAGINFQLRYTPFVLAARSIIEQGAIGELHDMEVRVTAYTPWHLWKFLEIVPFAEIIYHSIHYIDLMRAFLGDPKGVYAKSVKHPKASRIDGTSSDYALDYGDFVRSVITTNHHHEYGSKHQESYIKWEGSQGAIFGLLGVMLNYPKGVPDQLEYCLLQEGKEPEWISVPLPGNWFPDAFIGTMASLQRYAEGSTDCMDTSVDDAYRTMALVEAACQSSQSGGVPFESHVD
jgi:predicted dehydrogenase